MDAAGHDWRRYVVDYNTECMSDYYSTNWWLPVGPLVPGSSGPQSSGPLFIPTQCNVVVVN